MSDQYYLKLKCKKCNAQIEFVSETLITPRQIKNILKQKRWEVTGNNYLNLRWYCPNHSPYKKYFVGKKECLLIDEITAISKNSARSIYCKKYPDIKYIDTVAVEVK